MNQNKKEVHRVQELHLRSKEEFQQLYYDMKRDFDRYSERHDLHEVRMDQTINDTKFWLEKYTQAYKDNDI